MKRVTYLLICLCILLFAVSCRPGNPDNMNSSEENMSISVSPGTEEPTPETTVLTATTLETEETTALVTESVTVSIEPNATLPMTDPNLPPQTDPESAFLYGATLPEGYCAMIPAEGNQLAIYDEAGHFLRTTRYIGYDVPDPLGGVLPIGAIYDYGDPNGLKERDTEKDTYYDMFFREFPGAYITNEGDWGTYRIYNSSDQLIYTYENVESEYLIVEVDSDETGTAIFFQSDHSSNDEDYSWIYQVTVIMLNTEGEITEEYSFENLLGKPKQILGKEYILTGSYGSEPGVLYNRSGEIVMSGVIGIDLGLSVITKEQGMCINVYGYVEKDGILYDENLIEQEMGSLDANGSMIPGMDYEVNGIPCTAFVELFSYRQDTDKRIVAVGTLDDRIALRTDNGEYEIMSDNGTYVCSNNNVIVIRELKTLKVYDLESGLLLLTLPECTITAAPEYLIRLYFDETLGSEAQSVIDKEGKVRYVTNGEELYPTNEEFVFMVRGPYAGIADLDGNWLIRSLSFIHSRDADYHYKL